MNFSLGNAVSGDARFRCAAAFVRVWIGVAAAFLASGVQAQLKETDMSSHTWVVSERVDRMTGRTTKSASIWSVDKISLPPPYQGEQPVMLSVGKTPAGEEYVILGVVSGQFWCSDCQLRVRFGESAVEYWSATTKLPRTQFLYIYDAKRFIRAVSTSEKVLIEAPFYVAGPFPIEFHIKDFPLVPR